MLLTNKDSEIAAVYFYFEADLVTTANVDRFIKLIKRDDEFLFEGAQDNDVII